MPRAPASRAQPEPARAAQAAAGGFAARAAKAARQPDGLYTVQLPQHGVTDVAAARSAITSDDEETVITDTAALYDASAERAASAAAVARAKRAASVAVPTTGGGRSPAVVVLSGLLGIAVLAMLTLVWQVVSGGSSRAPDDGGTIALFTSPSGATVIINGDRTEHRTPTTLSGLELGVAHRIQLEMDGFRTAEDTILLSDTTLTQRQFEMLRDTGILTVRTVPPGAQIALDGQPRGPAPATLSDLDTARSFAVSATLDGHRPVARTVSWDAGAPREQLIVLTLPAIGDAVAGAPKPEDVEAAEAPPVEPVAVAEAVPAPAPPTPSTRTSDTSRSSRTSRSSDSSRSSRTSDSSRSSRSSDSSRSSRSSDSSRSSRSSSSRPSSRSSSDRPSSRTPPGRSSDSGSRSTSGRERPSARPSEAVAAPQPAGNGTVSIQAVPYGQVWVDGRMVSPETPLINHELSAGVHTVKVYYVSLRQFSDERSVRVEPGSRGTITFRASR